ncbi:MAG: carboxypeptidase-like regulatory domain-containing protein [candidate division WOR-3 bacterium]
MKKIIVIAMITLFAGCLKPPRDNPYDPDNPNKAYLAGYVSSADGKISGAEVKLLTMDDSIYSITSSNSAGWYEFTNVNPGIYKLIAFARNFIPTEYSPESLPAGSSDTVELYFNAVKYTFDEEDTGTVEPTDFKRLYGNWRVVNDSTAPSQPNAYNCFSQIGISNYAKTVSDFSIGLNFKFLTPVDTFSYAGVILRMKDTINYYSVSVSRKALIFAKIKNGNPIPLDYYPLFINQNQWYELWVDAIGSEFKIYFDGDLKIEKSDTEFSQGKVGLFISRETAPPISVNFDDVIICR